MEARSSDGRFPKRARCCASSPSMQRSASACTRTCGDSTTWSCGTTASRCTVASDTPPTRFATCGARRRPIPRRRCSRPPESPDIQNDTEEDFMNLSMPGRALRCAVGVLAIGAAITLPTVVGAQSTFPSKSIHLAVPFPPGGVSDAAARLVAEHMSKRLGQQVVVENRPGATGNVSGQHVAQAEPDGYTIMLAYNGIMTINPFVFERMPFDVTRDLAPIGKIGEYPFIITVNPNVEAKNLQELIALSKTRPTGLDYGTSGNGSNEHLIGTLIVQKAGAKLVHIPYKGGGPAMADAVAGHIPIGMASVAGGTQHVKS